jgi:endonuclease-3
MIRRERAQRIQRKLVREYPDPRCALKHRSAFQLLVATILSAQCTDERVNKVTPHLFSRYPNPQTLAEADPGELMDLIRSTGFFRNKTKALIGSSHRITERFSGRVPDTMEDLLTLPGVARKTANVVLGTWYGKNVGIVVDTHVQRLSRRMGLTRHRVPEKVEQDLMKVFPRREWTNLSHRLIAHGRRVCLARTPRCSDCVVGDVCPSFEPGLPPARGRGGTPAGAPKRVRAAGRTRTRSR